MIEIDELTPAQIAQLEQQIEARKKADNDRLKSEREAYKDLVNKTVREQIIDLQTVNNMLMIVKAQVFGAFSAIIALKQELYGVKSGQQSHTFTDEENRSITIGYRIIDSYDDTLDEGIALIREYIDSLAVDENTSKLVGKLNQLLKKDAKGNLRPNRAIELKNMAEEENDEKLRNGVDIILKSYKPKRSAIFIEAEVPDAIGASKSVALSITSADFPEGFTPNFDVFK